MNVQTVDERNVNVLWDKPTFRVLDWSQQDESQAFELADGDLWSALAWAETDRSNAPVLTELFVTTHEPGGPLVATLLGTISWTRSNGAVTTERTMVRDHLHAREGGTESSWTA
jgi:hypothetical protein